MFRRGALEEGDACVCVYVCARVRVCVLVCAFRERGWVGGRADGEMGGWGGGRDM